VQIFLQSSNTLRPARGNLPCWHGEHFFVTHIFLDPTSGSFWMSTTRDFLKVNGLTKTKWKTFVCPLCGVHSQRNGKLEC
jgi:hypothetical protein